LPEERLKLAVFIDFDNIQIGVKDTLGKEFDVSLVLEALKERGEVVAKIAYGDWARAGDHSRQMTQHAIQMVQRNVTPRGDKNGADINLALDALEMAFTRHHINAFAIVGGDSDFMALVEKLKQFDKQVFIIGGRAFTSNILQKNCTEFIAYENLLKSEGGRSRGSRRGESGSRSALETRSLAEALPNIQRALKILADRGVAPQLGLLKSTLLQLDSTFSEKDYGASSFLEFMQKVQRAGLAHLRRTERGFLVEPGEAIAEEKPASLSTEAGQEVETEEGKSAESASMEDEERPALAAPDPAALELLKQALAAAFEKTPGRPLYLRQIRQPLRALEPNFDERRYGYRGMLDFLHQAQRAGLLRLIRDHQGVWRIHPPSPAPTEVSASLAAGPVDATGTPMSASSEESALPSESARVVEFHPPEISDAETLPMEPSEPRLEVIPGAAQESETAPSSERKARRSRTPRAANRSSKRRTTSRRKTTRPEEP
jgi:uncharacterized protein (TIGR00288 family)